MATQASVNPFTASQLETLRQVAATLSAEGLQAPPTAIHTECPGCELPAPIIFRYGGPMADCRLCGYGWAVEEEGR